jgi:ABC-type sugar transport system ATPase subunit
MSGGTDPVIEIAGLRKAFDGIEALAGIDLAAEAGRVLALLGPNGAGKPDTGLRHLCAAITGCGSCLQSAGASFP